MTKERPIPFSGEMVRAILDGRKTMTRRVCRDQDPQLQVRHVVDNPTWPEHWKGKPAQPYTGWIVKYPNLGIWLPRNCPYGKAGDRLWVREEHYRYGHWEPTGALTKTGRIKYAFVPDSDTILYDPIEDARCGRGVVDWRMPGWYKRLARFMPRIASRITLEVVDVRCERLRKISGFDARAEGYPDMADYELIHYGGGRKCRLWFRELWDTINVAHPWESNPWVWVIEFRRIA